MAACNSQRVLIVLVVVLAIVAVIAVGMLVWRETRDEEKLKLTSENLQKVYSNHFRTDEQQTFFEQKYMEGIANRTVVTDKIPSINDTTCIFDCYNGEFGRARRKRQAQDDASINHGRRKWQMQGGATTNHGRIKRQGQGQGRTGTRHGCCESTVGFVSPDNKKNIYGQNRKLVQLTDLKQRFAEHKCQYVDRCMGCVCSQESNLHTAVVVKTSVSVAEYVDDTETDFFSLMVVAYVSITRCAQTYRDIRNIRALCRFTGHTSTPCCCFFTNHAYDISITSNNTAVLLDAAGSTPTFVCFVW